MINPNNKDHQETSIDSFGESEFLEGLVRQVTEKKILTRHVTSPPSTGTKFWLLVFRTDITDYKQINVFYSFLMPNIRS